jgi:hypothetical protein
MAIFGSPGSLLLQMSEAAIAALPPPKARMPSSQRLAVQALARSLMRPRGRGLLVAAVPIIVQMPERASRAGAQSFRRLHGRMPNIAVIRPF